MSPAARHLLDLHLPMSPEVAKPSIATIPVSRMWSHMGERRPPHRRLYGSTKSYTAGKVAAKTQGSSSSLSSSSSSSPTPTTTSTVQRISTATPTTPNPLQSHSAVHLAAHLDQRCTESHLCPKNPNNACCVSAVCQVYSDESMFNPQAGLNRGQRTAMCAPLASEGLLEDDRCDALAKYQGGIQEWFHGYAVPLITTIGSMLTFLAFDLLLTYVPVGQSGVL